MTPLPSAEEQVRELYRYNEEAGHYLSDSTVLDAIRAYGRAVLEAAAEVVVRARYKDRSYQWIEERIRKLKEKV